MTIIAWDGNVLAADKKATNHGFGSTVTKLFRLEHGGMAALCGDSPVALELLQWYRGNADAKYFPAKARDDVSSLIVVGSDRKLRVYSAGPIPEYKEDKFIAFGSGRDYALAAMYLGRTAREAVDVACYFDNCCGNGVDAMEVRA